MRLPVFILSLALLATPALAADAEGRITAIDEEKMTITLTDGATYKLPAEIDMTAVADGMEVIVAYQVNESGERQITDMVLPD